MSSLLAELLQGHLTFEATKQGPRVVGDSIEIPLAVVGADA